MNTKKQQAEAERLAAQEAEEERLYQLQITELNRKAKDETRHAAIPKTEKAEEVDRLTAQEAEEERLYQLQKTEANRKAIAETDRLAAQEAEEERLYQLQITEANRKVKGEVKQAETVSTKAPKKKSGSRGFMIGIVVVILLTIARTGFNAISNSGSGNPPVDNPVIEAPVVSNPATEAPVVADPATKVPVVVNTVTKAPVIVQNTATAPSPVVQEPTLSLSKNAYCRKSPSSEAEDVTAFLKGDSFPIVAQDSDGWWLVKINIPQITRRKACWIFGEGHILEGDYSSVPYKEDFEVGPEYNPP